jgi:hypothetical protein
MHLSSSVRRVLLPLFVVATLQSLAQPAPPPTHVFFRVQVASTLPGPVSGRLLIFLKQGAGDKEVSVSEFRPADTWVTAREIHDVAPGDSVEVDADEIAYPKPFAAIPAGIYEAQAVLDVDHTYNYSARNAKDWVSPVVALASWTPGAGAEPAFILDHHQDEDPRFTAMMTAMTAQAKPGVAQREEFESPLLTQFWGHSTRIKAWVILPPGYDEHAADTFPTAYWTHGFGGGIEYALPSGLSLRKRMEEGKMPPMIWVMLDESIPEGTHEFADSVNNGPWGAALTTEFIPYLEKKYRMEAHRPSAQRPLQRRMGVAAARGELSQRLRRNLVHFTRPQRLPRLHRPRSLRCQRQCLSLRRRLARSHLPRQGQGDCYLRAVHAS